MPARDSFDSEEGRAKRHDAYVAATFLREAERKLKDPERRQEFVLPAVRKALLNFAVLTRGLLGGDHAVMPVVDELEAVLFSVDADKPSTNELRFDHAQQYLGMIAAVLEAEYYFSQGHPPASSAARQRVITEKIQRTAPKGRKGRPPEL